VSLACAGPASADVLFADPAGSPAGTCKPPDPPCTLQRAVEVQAVGGDEVVLNSGTYIEGANEVTIDDPIDLHGAVGEARPTISSTAAGPAVDVDAAGAVVRDLRIEHSVAINGVALDIQVPATAERVIATSSANIACLPGLGAVIRDSICHSTALNEAAVRFFTSGGPSTATLINVTAVASAGNSNAIDLQVFDQGVQTLNATNVVASGSGTAADVSAVNNGDAFAEVTINLDHSNYDTENEPGGDTTVTDPGSGTNQLAAPQFSDAASAGFHQLAGSPTIDAGAAVAGLGAADIDGEARRQGAAPDIGADEFTVAAPPPAGDKFPPDTGIRKGPKKKTFKRHIKFEFGGSEPGVTFECQLDDNGWEPCTSPKKYKRLKRGKHVFAVRAIDAAGNADPTPADRKWKITEKPKHED
jgi:hypothetical protein